MEWNDQGILLAVRAHGESAAIIDVLTQRHGRHAGLVRGGSSRKFAALLQPGNLLSLSWKARLEEQLGSFSVELKRANSGHILSSRQKLYGFNALSAMLARYLPEREVNESIFGAVVDILSRYQSELFWQHKYCLFELEFLNALGYGLDLSQCAATGQSDDLAYVSPKTGRAVSRDGAKGWENRLLVFPEFLQQDELRPISSTEFRQSLTLSGYFFAKHVPVTPPKLPEARLRFSDIV